MSCVAVELHRNAANGPMLAPPNVGKEGRDRKLSIVMVRAVAHVDSACTGIGVMRISEQKEKKQEKSAGFLFVAPRPGFPSSFPLRFSAAHFKTPSWHGYSCPDCLIFPFFLLLCYGLLSTLRIVAHSLNLAVPLPLERRPSICNLTTLPDVCFERF